MNSADFIIGVSALALLLLVVIFALCKVSGDSEDDGGHLDG